MLTPRQRSSARNSHSGVFLTPPGGTGSLPSVFGSIGGSEVILLFILALLIFGPRKLPEIGRTLGKAMADFRRATNDFKANLERAVLDLVASVGAPSPAAPSTPEKPADPELPATSESTATTDGGTDSIH
jgi:sec-independent protein translocase protein TatA